MAAAAAAAGPAELRCRSVAELRDQGQVVRPSEFFGWFGGSGDFGVGLLNGCMHDWVSTTHTTGDDELGLCWPHIAVMPCCARTDDGVHMNVWWYVAEGRGRVATSSGPLREVLHRLLCRQLSLLLRLLEWWNTYK